MVRSRHLPLAPMIISKVRSAAAQGAERRKGMDGPEGRGGGEGRGGLACCLCVLFSSAAGGAYWPIAIRFPSLGPFSSVGGGAHRPLTTL